MVVTAPVALAAFYANESPPAVPAGRWLAGMNSLQRHLNEGLPQKAVIITPARLRHEAALLRTCTTGLAKLGIPTDDFQQNYQQARQACTYFDRAAACDTAAASAYTTAPGGPAADKFQRLINCSDTGVNKGIEFLSFATGAGPA